MSNENWRSAPDDASVFFGHQKKRLELEARKPVIRRPADLVGPGIAASAVRISDFNDLLALYNGYYAAPAGTFGGPAADEGHTGFTVMDDLLGGTQVFTGMVSGKEWKRIFRRNPSDPASVSFAPWVDQASLVGAQGPQGIQGPEGPQGPQGVKGDTGAAGAGVIPEMGYSERTTNTTTTNTVFYGGTALAGLSLALTGEGKAVDISFEGLLSVSALNASVAVWMLINGSTNAPGGYLGMTGPFASVNNQRTLNWTRRMVLTQGTVYNITLGWYINIAGTATLTATAQYPASLRARRVA